MKPVKISTVGAGFKPAQERNEIPIWNPGFENSSACLNDLSEKWDN